MGYNVSFEHHHHYNIVCIALSSNIICFDLLSPSRAAIKSLRSFPEDLSLLIRYQGHSFSDGVISIIRILIICAPTKPNLQLLLYIRSNAWNCKITFRYRRFSQSDKLVWMFPAVFMKTQSCDDTVPVTHWW